MKVASRPISLLVKSYKHGTALGELFVLVAILQSTSDSRCDASRLGTGPLSSPCSLTLTLQSLPRVLLLPLSPPSDPVPPQMGRTRPNSQRRRRGGLTRLALGAKARPSRKRWKWSTKAQISRSWRRLLRPLRRRLALARRLRRMGRASRRRSRRRTLLTVRPSLLSLPLAR